MLQMLYELFLSYLQRRFGVVVRNSISEIYLIMLSMTGFISCTIPYSLLSKFNKNFIRNIIRSFLTSIFVKELFLKGYLRLKGNESEIQCLAKSR